MSVSFEKIPFIGNTVCKKKESFPKWDLINRLCLGYLYCSGLVSQVSAKPISLLYPLPDISIDPGTVLNQNIKLKNYCWLSDPNQNVELSIQQANGQRAPSWISMGMGGITPINSKYLGIYDSVGIDIRDTSGYVLTNNDASLNILNISNSDNPTLMGTFLSKEAQDMAINGNYAYLVDRYNVTTIDISNSSKPAVIKQVKSPVGSYFRTYSNNGYLYVFSCGDSNKGNTDLTIFDIRNGANPVLLHALEVGSADGPYPALSVSGNYAAASTYRTIYLFNVTNPSNPVLAKKITSVGQSTLLIYKNYLFINNGGMIYIYDISTLNNPKLITSVYIFNLAGSLTAQGNYIYASPCSKDISCGGSIMTIVDITDVQNAKVVATVPTLGSATQSSLNGNQLYLANGGAGLSIYDASLRVLSGTPGITDRGLLLLNVTVQNDAGDSLQDQIAIHVGALQLAIPIQNEHVFVGNSSLLTLPIDTFEFPNTNFIYSAKLVGGLPLPSFIHFDSETRTFLFTPQSGDQNTYRIQVTGDTGYGKTISTTFDLLVPNRPPFLSQPLGNQTAYTGEFFEYFVSRNSFSDADSDQLQFSATLSDGNALPGWLAFDPALLRFYGTPYGRNTYQIQIQANDSKGGVALGTFSITVPNSAPFLLNPIRTQFASAGTPFRYTLYSKTFFDFDSDVLTYSTSELPPFLNFDAVTKTFTGTPQIEDAGTISINIYAQDPFGANDTAVFTLTVLGSSSGDLPPVMMVKIPDMRVTAGIPFNTTFNEGTFEDPQGQFLAYTATLEGGDPLPEGLNFDAEAFSLYGSVKTQQIWRISIKATDPYGGFAISTFTFTAADGTKYPPIVLNPLHDELATVGTPFFYQVPLNTFKELSGDSLTITVIQSGNLALPAWLKWDPETRSFTGTPGPFDTNTYANKEHIIDVWAADGTGSVKSSFKIIVNGESFFATFIKYGFSIASVVGSGIGIWKSRALIRNYFFKHRTRTQRAFAGQFYRYELKIPSEKIKEVRAYRSGKPLPQQEYLPEGLIYHQNQLQGTPSLETVGQYTIYITDHKGYIKEKLDLIIIDPDSPIETAKSNEHYNQPLIEMVELNL